MTYVISMFFKFLLVDCENNLPFPELLLVASSEWFEIFGDWTIQQLPFVLASEEKA